jgi:hypothetical protein
MKLRWNVLSDAKLHRESDLSGNDDPRNYSGPEVLSSIALVHNIPQPDHQ